jgi:uncharacterized delta-60 repeat protein
MKKARLFAFLGVSVIAVTLIFALGGMPGAGTPAAPGDGGHQELLAGRNVNMVSGKTLPWGDPWLQRQNEPSIAISSRNPMHLFAGANDYRTIDMPDDPTKVVPGIPIQIAAARDAWLGVFKSFDGGESWITTLLPGYPQDESADALTSPIHGYDTACDPGVQAGANGLFFMSGIAFNRSGRAGAVFVSRWIDNNNLEKVRLDNLRRPSKDSIEYVDTKVIGVGGPGQFLDMPSIAVDLPRPGSGTNLVEGQNIPNARVYLAYTIFPGTTGKNVRSKLYFARSTNSGKSWYAPIKVSESQNLIQRAIISIDPSDPTGNTLYVAYRRFAFDVIPDAIVVVKSTNGGATFSKPLVVTNISFPFDQLMAENRFRTNSYPTMAVDQSGIVSIAWSERRTRNGAPAADGQARVVISSSPDGFTWTPPAAVELADPMEEGGLADGHQIMPSMTYAGGKLMLVWYDQRRTLAKETGPNSITPLIEDSPGNYRHTLDVRAAEGVPGQPPAFFPSQQVSRYLHYFEVGSDGEPVLGDDGFYKLIQAEYNPVNFHLFQQGTRPFIGDYIDLASSPKFLPPPLTGGSVWRPNFDGTANPTMFQAAWTDNRDVRPPLPDWWGDWTTYSSPNSDQDPFMDFAKTIPCQGTTAGKRNQNIYTASLTDGVQVGSPGNTKQLDLPRGTPGGGRTFTVFVRNLTEAGPRTFVLSFGAVAGGVGASFKQNEDQPTRSVTVGPFSSASVTVYVDRSTSLNGLAPVKVDVREGLKLVGYVLLNPDRTNLPVLDPDGSTSLGDEDHTPGVSDPKIWKYDLGSGKDPHPGAGNPRVQNPRVQNSGLVNPRVQNAGQENPRVQNKSLTNENIVNSETGNPRVQNPRVQNAALTDVTWTVTNNGNTTSCYSFYIAAENAQTLNPYFENGTLYGQLLIYRVHTTPLDDGCELEEEHHDELIVNVTNPRVQNPRVQNTSPNNAALLAAKAGPLAAEPDLTDQDATFWLAPDEEAYVIFRVFDPFYGDLDDGIDFDPQSFASEVEAEAVNTGDTDRIIETQPDVPWWDPVNKMPEIGLTPSPILLGAVGGANPANSYLTIWNAGGRALDYTIQVSIENSGTWLTVDPLAGTSTSPGDEKVHTLAVDATGLVAGTYHATVTVNDPSAANNPRVVPVTLTVYASIPSLAITTTSIKDAVRGTFYTAVLDCAGGLNPKSWSLASGSLPPGLSIESTEGGYALLIGTPTTAGYYSFTVQVTDSLPQTVTQNLSMTVADWVVRYNGPGDSWDQVSDSVVDSQGNVYVTGLSRNSTNADFATIKYDSAGNEEWVARYNGPANNDDSAHALAVDALGNVYVTGASWGVGTNSDYATIKYDSNGNELWVARYNGTGNAGDGAYAVAVDASGFVYVAGQSQGSGTESDYATIKYDRDGNQLWAARYNGPGNSYDFAMSMAVDPAGNVYVTGSSQPSGTGGNLYYDYATVKYDNNGNEVGTARYNGPGNSLDVAFDIALDASGNVFVTGHSQGETGTNNDYATIKYDSSLAQLAEARYNGPGNDDDQANRIVIDPSGNVYVTGRSQGSGTDNDFATVKYDNDLNQLAVARYNGPGNGVDGALGLVVDPTGNVYITGYSRGSGTDDDYATVKYDSSLNQLWAARYNGPASALDQAYSMALDPRGNVYVAGESTGSGNQPLDYATIKYFQTFPSTLIITTDSLDNGHAGLPYAAAVWAFGGGGVRQWMIGEEAILPPELVMNSNTGVISGTPTTPGVYNFSVYLIDGALPTVSKSLSITITAYAPPPHQLAFIQPPTTAIVGQTIAPAVTVEVQDASGNRVTTATNPVTLSLRNGTGTLGGTLTRNAVGGIATFDDLSVSAVGTGYQLRANSGSLTEVDSVSFNIIAAGALDHFDFSGISSPQAADMPIAITITAKDALENTVTSYVGTNGLTADAGSINRYTVDIVPTSTTAFVNGVWTGTATFFLPNTVAVQIQTTGGGRSGDSNMFDVYISIPMRSSRNVLWRPDPITDFVIDR